MDKKKTYINMVVVGHIGSGKFTCSGHLMYKCGTIDKRMFERAKTEAAQMGSNRSAYAFIMENNRLPRERGICLHIPPTRFATNAYHVTIVDGPENRNFIRNMITGHSQAELTMLVVSAGSDEFEVGISKNGQTCEHIHLAYICMNQMIVIINKMDATDPPFSEKRYNDIKNELSAIIKKIGYQPESIAFIPVSASLGDNIIEPSENMPWYTGWTVERTEGNLTGKTLIEAIDASILPEQLSEKPLRLPIEDIYKISGVGTVAVGCVKSGILKTNMKVTFAPLNISTEVKSIEMYHESIDEAQPGDRVGFNVPNISVKELRSGFVCSDSNNDLALEVSSFIALIVVLNHPGKIRRGYTPVINCHTAHIACKFVELISKIHRQTGKIIEEAPEFIKSGECAFVKLIPTKPMCVEKFADYPSLGRFAVRDLRQTVAVGIIKDVEKRLPMEDKIVDVTFPVGNEEQIHEILS